MLKKTFGGIVIFMKKSLYSLFTGHDEENNFQIFALHGEVLKTSFATFIFDDQKFDYGQENNYQNMCVMVKF
jgi:hypothetical protein